MTVVHPIARAWISTGGTGAQNYDEFADDAEITAIIAANPDSALAIEMPHRAPDSLGQIVRRRAARRGGPAGRGQKADGRYAAAEDGRRAVPDHRPGRPTRPPTGLWRWSTPTRSPPAPTSPAW